MSRFLPGRLLATIVASLIGQWAVAGPLPPSVSAGVGLLGVFDAKRVASFSADFRFPIEFYRLQPRLVASWATEGSQFVGVGLLIHRDVTRRWRLTAGFAPGYYDRRRGRNLGSALEFISTFEVARGFRGAAAWG